MDANTRDYLLLSAIAVVAPIVGYVAISASPRGWKGWAIASCLLVLVCLGVYYVITQAMTPDGL